MHGSVIPLGSVTPLGIVIHVLPPVESSGVDVSDESDVSGVVESDDGSVVSVTSVLSLDGSDVDVVVGVSKSESCGSLKSVATIPTAPLSAGPVYFRRSATPVCLSTQLSQPSLPTAADVQERPWRCRCRPRRRSST